MKGWAESCLRLLFPPLCLHCGAPYGLADRHFCMACSSLLELINTKERCPRCFGIDYCPQRKLCGTCPKRKSALVRIGAAFDHEGPAATLVQRMKYGGQPYLAKGAAAFLALQFHALEWPLPDLIVPVPISPIRLFDRGYNQSAELAHALAPYLNRPVAEVLKKRSGTYSQAGLTRQLRMQLEASTFALRRRIAIEDKVLLLIDDVTTTGSTLERCAEVLQEGYPQAVYALTLCRAVK